MQTQRAKVTMAISRRFLRENDYTFEEAAGMILKRAKQQWWAQGGTDYELTEWEYDPSMHGGTWLAHLYGDLPADAELPVESSV